MQQNIIGKLKIGSLFIINPTLRPQTQKPQEEEYTDCKILSFYPKELDIHEKRKQVGISEGIVSFFLPFSESEEPIQCISTLDFTHVMKEIEKDIWLNIVIQHPEQLYNIKIDQEHEAETIANQKFQSGMFREEDSKIFYKLIDNFYKYFYMFHGPITDLFEKYPETFQQLVDDFTMNFDKHFFKADYEKNFFWNLAFQGLFYCPIEKKAFLQSQLIVNSLLNEYEKDIQEVLVFHDEFYVSSTLGHEQAQSIYSYLIGSGECQRDQRKVKAYQYKQGGKTFRLQSTGQQQINQTLDNTSESQSLQEQYVNIQQTDLIGQEESQGISNFCKINNSLIQLSQAHRQALFQHYIIGPVFNYEQKYIDLFAPRIFIKKDGSDQQYRMIVFVSGKTMVVMLFNIDYVFTYKFLESVTEYLKNNMAQVSSNLDSIVSKVLNKDDPIRFFYFNHMNLAMKFSNIVTQEIFTLDLIVLLNQMHEQFTYDQDCQEQHMNNTFYWLVGINSMGREIYLIFPPNYSSSKVEVEKKKIMQQYFKNLFI